VRKERTEIHLLGPLSPAPDIHKFFSCQPAQTSPRIPGPASLAVKSTFSYCAIGKFEQQTNSARLLGLRALKCP
jgi:hypothetical protein